MLGLPGSGSQRQTCLVQHRGLGAPELRCAREAVPGGRVHNQGGLPVRLPSSTPAGFERGGAGAGQAAFPSHCQMGSLGQPWPDKDMCDFLSGVKFRG